ncbi:MAG: hypothetical protein LBP36_02990, partial [Oscillospiraceae bacterium]|nr:hypothetical protein [Oscillospiraceae bacterium]
MADYEQYIPDTDETVASARNSKKLMDAYKIMNDDSDNTDKILFRKAYLVTRERREKAIEEERDEPKSKSPTKTTDFKSIKPDTQLKLIDKRFKFGEEIFKNSCKMNSPKSESTESGINNGKVPGGNKEKKYLEKTWNQTHKEFREARKTIESIKNIDKYSGKSKKYISPQYEYGDDDDDDDDEESQSKNSKERAKEIHSKHVNAIIEKEKINGAGKNQEIEFKESYFNSLASNLKSLGAPKKLSADICEIGKKGEEELRGVERLKGVPENDDDKVPEDYDEDEELCELNEVVDEGYDDKVPEDYDEDEEL